MLVKMLGRLKSLIMSYKRPTIKMVLDTRSKSKTSLFPVKIRITYNRQPRLYSTGIELSEDDFNKVFKSLRVRNSDLRLLRDQLLEIELEVQSICDSLNPFDFKRFKQLFYKEEVAPDNQDEPKGLKNYFINYIEYFKKKGSISSSLNYKCAWDSILKFSPEIEFETVTPTFLNNYEKWMVEQGRSVTTISMYLRCLRAMFNQAIDEDVVERKDYPFGRRKYQIPAVRNIKKALTKEEIREIMNHPLEYGSNRDKARDFWILSYMCNGLNVKDILNLKHENVEDKIITVIRAKTRTSLKSNSRPIVIPLTPEIRRIIDKWSISFAMSDDFLFDQLQKEDSPKRERDKVQNFTRFINKNMAKVCKEIGIKKKVTTYSARHSFSTILKNSGVPVEYISEALGHTTIKTTQSYLDSFSIKQADEFARHLL